MNCQNWIVEDALGWLCSVSTAPSRSAGKHSFLVVKKESVTFVSIGELGLQSPETSASCVMMCRAGAKEWMLLQPAEAPISPPSTFHSCCSSWWRALTGCHAFLPWCSGERLSSHKHNLVHSEILPSLLCCLSSTTHVNRKFYFIFW